ncbi:MAG TPA: asparagine synthase (glutamine-hydrolyzing) [Candidatus Andersenbacteria bacterium]|nr:asparagine synthase (glutamine-hydrolyzing) [Candidatus Andersenbacteria bacterium]
MCGIAGKVSLGMRNVTDSEIFAMNAAIAHRGPDDEGIYVSPSRKVGLGHRRLSIIDLSPAGKQPMRYLDRYQIVFNGEIYNFQEQKKKLILEGYEFKSDTDTEVILALYDKYKKQCVEYLRGMFAFAIYDEKDNTIFCARDRVGQKPFKYYQNENVFIFASELKAILTQPEYKKDPDRDAIFDFLILQYVPEDSTGFQNIKKLLPGHILFIDIEKKETNIEQYWDIKYFAQNDVSEQAWTGIIREKLQESVEEQMVADVPVGAMLSGGIDSSVIVSLMAECSTKPIETFSVGFTGETLSELPYARQVSKKFKTNHHELYIKPASTEILQQLVEIMEEPFGDHGALPTLLISKLMKEHVTVALNGDGGDENFAGYDRYTAVKVANILAPYAKPIALLGNVLPNISKIDRVHRFIESLSFSPERRYLEYICYMSPEVLHRNSIPAIKSAFASAEFSDWLQQLLSVDLHTYLPGALLPKVDMTTMAYSLEARSPFFDHRFIEMAAQIPSNLKIKGFNNRKYILKSAFRNIIPNDILDRKKRGFSVPLSEWFQDNFLLFVSSILTSPSARIREYVNHEYVRDILRIHEHLGTQGRQLWILLMLELWLKHYDL